MSRNRAPRIGASVLETLTTGMYSNPLDTIREYVQNAFDSIRSGEREGLLKAKKGQVEVILDRKARTLTVRDNGPAIPANDILDRLLDIGLSTKDIGTNAGFRGIGRLAGMAYCKKLEFRSHFPGEPTETIVTHDAAELRRSMRPGQSERSEMQEILARCTEVDTARAQGSAGYFQVHMQDIDRAGEVFLDYNSIFGYLQEIAPVPFDSQAFGYASEIANWLRERQIWLPESTVVLQDGSMRSQVLKPYKNGPYKTAQNFKIWFEGIKFFPEDARAETPYWGWYVETDRPGAFEDLTVAGLRVRTDNIGVGGAGIMREIFRSVAASNDRFNNWFIGEVHIRDRAVIPNARRDHFEDTKEWFEIKRHLEDFARLRAREARKSSDARGASVQKLTKPVAKILVQVEKKLATGLTGDLEREDLRSKLEAHQQKLDNALNPARTDTEREQLERTQAEVTKTLQHLEKASVYVGSRLKTSLDRKQRRLLRDILELLYEILPEEWSDKAKRAIMNKYGMTSGDLHE